MVYLTQVAQGIPPGVGGGSSVGKADLGTVSRKFSDFSRMLFISRQNPDKIGMAVVSSLLIKE